MALSPSPSTKCSRAFMRRAGRWTGRCLSLRARQVPRVRPGMGQGKRNWVGFDCICDNYTHHNDHDDVNNSTVLPSILAKHLTVYKALI